MTSPAALYAVVCQREQEYQYGIERDKIRVQREEMENRFPEVKKEK